MCFVKVFKIVEQRLANTVFEMPAVNLNDLADSVYINLKLLIKSMGQQQEEPS